MGMSSVDHVLFLSTKTMPSNFAFNDNGHTQQLPSGKGIVELMRHRSALLTQRRVGVDVDVPARGTRPTWGFNQPKQVDLTLQNGDWWMIYDKL